MVDEKTNVADADEEQDDAVIGTAFRWSSLVIGLLAIIIGGALILFNRAPDPVTTAQTKLAKPKRRETTEVTVPNVMFREITEEAGIDFYHVNGAYGDKLLPETMGGGCAFFDYDNDGDQDIIFVNSQHWPHRDAKANNPATMRLYANDGTGKFNDVTDEAQLAISLYGMGVAVGDYDNDGWRDLFISAVGANRLLHNVNGKFEDVTDTMNVAGNADDWSTSCAWFDYDNDADLDLFVCNYVDWSKDDDLSQDCKLVGHGRAYCPPIAFGGSFPYLYRNDGDKFTDVSKAAGVQIRNSATDLPLAKSLGVVPVDLNHDGWLDLVVANDTVQNLLFRNKQDGTFEEMGAICGVAFDSAGKARGAMGIDAGYHRNDNSVAIGIGNFANEMSALYVCQGKQMLFTDDALATGLGPPTRLLLTFGLFFFDYDLDSRLDLFAANGHLEDEINKVQSSQQYKQPPQLFWNAGPDQRTEFVSVTAEQSGSEFFEPIVGRGAAYADIDADGDLDVLITATGGAPRLLRNDQATGNNWLRLKLVGAKCNRDAIGAVIELAVGGQKIRRLVMPTRSYLSQVELPVTIGLGKITEVESLKISWPGGATVDIPAPELNQLHVIEQE